MDHSPEDTQVTRAFDAVVEELDQPPRPRALSEVRMPMLAVLLALLLVVLAVLAGVQPLLRASQRLAMASERQRVQTAIEAYHMLDQLPAIPARGVPQCILPGDADAPFGRFLRGPTRYAYRWFEGGLGVHAVDDEPPEAYGALAVAALAHDLLRSAGNTEGLFPEGDGLARLQTHLEQHIQGGNALGLVNAASGSEAVWQAGEGPPPGGAAPAVLISQAPVHAYRYLKGRPEEAPKGSIVVYQSNAAAEAEVFLVRPDGRPAYLLLVGGPGAAPRRGSAGW